MNKWLSKLLNGREETKNANNLYRYFTLKEGKQNTQRPTSIEDSMERRGTESKFHSTKTWQMLLRPLFNTNNLKFKVCTHNMIWQWQFTSDTLQYREILQHTWPGLSETVGHQKQRKSEKHHSQQEPNETIASVIGDPGTKRILGKTKKTWIKYRF